VLQEIADASRLTYIFVDISAESVSVVSCVEISQVRILPRERRVLSDQEDECVDITSSSKLFRILPFHSIPIHFFVFSLTSLVGRR
jgi:hypothetical protein